MYEILLETKIITQWHNIITRGHKILLPGMNYYSREQNITREKYLLLAGIKYYSRVQVITRGNKIGIVIAPESFRTLRVFM